MNGRDPEQPKQAVAYVVDGMGGHLAFSADGDKTVIVHSGAGGTRYYFDVMHELEQQTTARTVMVRWAERALSNQRPTLHSRILSPGAGFRVRPNLGPTWLNSTNGSPA